MGVWRIQYILVSYMVSFVLECCTVRDMPRTLKRVFLFLIIVGLWVLYGRDRVCHFHLWQLWWGRCSLLVIERVLSLLRCFCAIRKRSMWSSKTVTFYGFSVLGEKWIMWSMSWLGNVYIWCNMWFSLLSSKAFMWLLWLLKTLPSYCWQANLCTNMLRLLVATFWSLCWT